MKRTILTAVLGALLAAPCLAGNAEDDLQAVKRAVANSSGPHAERPPAEAPEQAQRARRHGSADTVWFRVRVKEKGRKGGSFSLNLPIGLARVLGDDWPLDSRDGCRQHSRCHVTLGQILKSLDSGQSLVDIEDEDASVHIWVE